MTQRKAERLMNLTILLLTARHYVTKDQIRAATEPYRTASDEAFEKMFERDKEELRTGGVPIEVGTNDLYFDDEPGYRIRRSAFELPEIRFSREESALLGVAARVWQQAGLTSETQGAMTKFRAAGVEVDQEALTDVAPRLVASEAAFGAMWDATMKRQQVEFDYTKTGATRASRRRLRPYRVTSVGDRWYVVGHDLDRDEPRMFRLSRVTGDVRAVGKVHSFEVPADLDLDALTESLAPAPRQGEAIVLVRPGAALQLRRRGTVKAEGVGGPLGTTWDRLHLPLYDVERMAADLLAHGSAVLVEEPADLRDAVLSGLRALGEGR